MSGANEVQLINTWHLTIVFWRIKIFESGGTRKLHYTTRKCALLNWFFSQFFSRHCGDLKLNRFTAKIGDTRFYWTLGTFLFDRVETKGPFRNNVTQNFRFLSSSPNFNGICSVFATKFNRFVVFKRPLSWFKLTFLLELWAVN